LEAQSDYRRTTQKNIAVLEQHKNTVM